MENRSESLTQSHIFTIASSVGKCQSLEVNAVYIRCIPVPTLAQFVSLQQMSVLLKLEGGLALAVLSRIN